MAGGNRSAESDRLDRAGGVQLGVVGLDGEQAVECAGENWAKHGGGEDKWNAAAAGSIRVLGPYHSAHGGGM